jgi:hypothetical protein
LLENNKNKITNLNLQFGNVYLVLLDKSNLFEIDVTEYSKTIYFDNLTPCNFKLIAKGSPETNLNIASNVYISGISGLQNNYSHPFLQDNSFVEIQGFCDGENIFLKEAVYV